MDSTVFLGVAIAYSVGGWVRLGSNIVLYLTRHGGNYSLNLNNLCQSIDARLGRSDNFCFLCTTICSI